MTAAFRTGKTVIELAAIEPHVLNLIHFLQSLGISIEINFDHTIIIDGIKYPPEEALGKVIYDYIESGTFVVLGALTASPSIEIRNARIEDL